MIERFYPNHPIHEHLQKRILILDGAMGTMVQALKLDYVQLRGERFANHPTDLSNYIDILSLTQPEAVTEIHRRYLAAGADIIELGVPFSDPMADGPVIQRASERALEHTRRCLLS